MTLINCKGEILKNASIHISDNGARKVTFFDNVNGFWSRMNDKDDRWVPIDSELGQKRAKEGTSDYVANKRYQSHAVSKEHGMIPDPEPWKGSKDEKAAKNNWNRLMDITVEKLGVNVSQVTPDVDFIEDLGADSFDYVELGLAFEDEFGIGIPEEEMNKMRTPRLVARWLNTQKFPFAIPSNGGVAAEFLRVTP